jgi:hypothetical protein
MCEYLEEELAMCEKSCKRHFVNLRFPSIQPELIKLWQVFLLVH